MTKLDWDRTRPGGDGYDAALAREWSTGPSGASFERPDGEDHLKLLSSPTIYWAKEMARAFPKEDEQSHLVLYEAARDAAATIYYRSGWATVRARVQAVHAKASTLNPFPSAYYALYFDHWAMTFARGDHLNRIGSVPRHIQSFAKVSERWVRAFAILRVLDKKRGRSDIHHDIGKFHDWLVGLNQDLKRKEAGQ